MQVLNSLKEKIMNLDDLRGLDEALYLTLDIITYHSISYDYVNEKNYVFFKREYLAYKTNMTKKQIEVLATFATSKLLNNPKFLLQYYVDCKALTASPELSVQLVLRFLEYNTEKQKRGMPPEMCSGGGRSIFSSIKNIFSKKEKQSKSPNIENIYELLDKVNLKTDADTLLALYEKIYFMYT